MIVKHYLMTEDSLNNKPFEEGCLYVTEDTNRIFLDPVGGGSRILISSDPIILPTESDRENLLAPIEGKLYLVLSSSTIYVYSNGEWSSTKSIYTHPTFRYPEDSTFQLLKIQLDNNNGHVSNYTYVTKNDITALGIPGQDTVYTHPSYTARTSGLYKITVDSSGHVSSVAAATKADITALGIPAQDTVYTHPTHTAKSSGLYKITVDGNGHVSGATAVTKADITGLGIPAQDTTYSAAGSALGLVKSGGDVTISDGVITVNDNSHNHDYLPLSGGTVSGVVTVKRLTISDTGGNRHISFSRPDGANYLASPTGSSIAICVNDTLSLANCSLIATQTLVRPGTTGATSLGSSTYKWGNIYGTAVYGAVWNDYAEYRDQKEDIKPGYCVASSDNGQISKTTEKFQACDGIVSDTFGFAIGETDKCKTPLAVAGRVLAYCEGDRYSYHAGDTVCAGPDGKVVKMTREEIREWPDRVVGIVSEIPEYETWGTGNVAVDGRIWIKVR